MTAAGQAMVVLVPIRQSSAFRNVDDVDAKNMGLVDEELERVEAVTADWNREMQTNRKDKAAFHAEREAMRKARKGQLAGADALRMKPPKEEEKRGLPGFLKVKGSREEDAAARDTEASAASSGAAASAVPDDQCVKRRRTERPEDVDTARDGVEPTDSSAAAVPATSGAGPSLGTSLAGYSSDSSEEGEEAEEE
uniref:Uncharacterized protein n=1 Tax=Alexandrium andersonii TaxID=327968 RepID=A0A7S2BAX0_9DINO|mmetsp:Transcript_2403/g.5403  ORF Transcript_2403/g.5403 Transcript_2403/m.5403 type:complete len:195 (+) Transcript_2403:116-700(+)